MQSSSASTQCSSSEQQPPQKHTTEVLKHVGQYIIFKEQLGQGQFSTVYTAMDKTDPTHSIYYAVKVIPLSKIPPDRQHQYREILQKEIDILQQVRHDNLICLYDMKQSPSNVYLFLDYCNGGDLRSYIAKKFNRLSEEEAVDIFKQLVNGYKALYEKKIIHRDLKPDNILMHNGKVKIGDFGFARFMETDRNIPVRMTQKCSPLYAPPQLLQNNEYSSKCDVWSMGVLLYEILYGETPFNARDMLGLIQDIKTKVYKEQYKFKSYPIISSKVKDILSKMLTYEEADRISWEEIFKHPVFNQSFKQIISFENKYQDEKSKSIEKNRLSLNDENYKLVSECGGFQYQQYLILQQQQNQANNKIVPEGTEESNQMEDEQYVMYMTRIKRNQDEEQMLRTLDNFINFSRNRAIFANIVLQNFWFPFQQYNKIQSYQKCQLLYYLCSYYYFSISLLKQIIKGERKQMMFKEEQFKIYCSSQFSQSTRDVIFRDFYEAELLYQDLQPLCYKEIENKMQDTDITIQQKSELQEILLIIQSKQDNPEMMKIKFVDCFKLVFSLIDLNDPSLDHSSLKGLYMMEIFAKLDENINMKKFQEFDFKKFYEDEFNKPTKEELINKLIDFKIKFLSI